MAALRNRQSSCCERIISISTAAETSSTSFPRYRYSRALLPSLNTPNTVLAPDVCKSLCSLGIYDRNQACLLWKRQKRSYGVGFIRRGKTVDTIKQKHPLCLTSYADKLCFCFAISDGLLPTNLVAMCVRPSFLAALISWASLLVVIDVAGQGGNARTVAVVASRAGLSPSLSPTDRGPGLFTLSALRLMILSDLSQISAVQHMGYLILT